MEHICQTNQTLNLRTVFFITALVNHIQKKRNGKKSNVKHAHTKELDWVNIKLKARISYEIWSENKTIKMNLKCLTGLNRFVKTTTETMGSLGLRTSKML